MPQRKKPQPSEITMPRTGMLNPAPSSQIIPLTDHKPQQQPKPKRIPAPKLTTHDKLIEAQIEIDRLQRDLEMIEGERNISREETKAAKRQLVDVVQFKNAFINSDIEFFETGLDHGIWENRIQMRRRISRGKGARDYQGSIEGRGREE